MYKMFPVHYTILNAAGFLAFNLCSLEFLSEKADCIFNRGPLTHW